jgi:exodeoxyribonuclease V beta subunit
VAFVRYLQASGKLGLQELRSFAKRVVGSPDLKVISKAPAAVRAGEGEPEWQVALAQCAKIWSDERDEVCKVLLESPALNRTSYKKEAVMRWITALDSLLRPGASGPFEGKWLQNLAQSSIATKTKKGHTPPKHRFFESMEDFLRGNQSLLQSYEARREAFLQRFASHVSLELARRKEEAAQQGFEDLLLLLRKALRASGGAHLAQALAERYPVALIDEFQDTDPVQYEVFRRIYHSDKARGLFLIGDPKQAIYAFRGADLFTYLAAREDAEALHSLDTNWRSDPALIRGVNTLFSRHELSFLYPEIRFQPVQHRPDASDLYKDRSGAALEAWYFEKESGGSADLNRSMVVDECSKDIARVLTGEVQIAGESVSPGDIAVLCRTNQESQLVWDALRARGIPAVLETEASVFESMEATELERVLRAVVDPGYGPGVRTALATSLLGLGAAEILTLHSDEDSWDRWIALFREWHRLWHERGFVQVFRRIMTECGVAGRLLGAPAGQRRMTNLYHLAELLQAQSIEHRLGPRLLLQWFELMGKDARARAEDVGDSSQLRLESDADAVQVVTIHKSKGLEYPIVYCPFTYASSELRRDEKRWVRFHDPDDERRVKVDVGSERLKEHRELASREGFAEALRLLYVALTRAKHRCVFSWGRLTGFESSALGYLLHLESGESDPKSLSARLKKADDAELLADLHALELRSDGALRVVRKPLAEEGPRYRRPSTGTRLAARHLTRPVRRDWRSSSFSSLVRGGHESDARDFDAETGRAVDESAASVTLGSGTTALPRGARFGLMIHSIFENFDFEEGAVELAAAVERARVEYGYDMEIAEPVLRVMQSSLQAPIGPEGWTLKSVSRSSRIDELEFNLPVRSERRALLPGELGEVLKGRVQPPYGPGYEKRVAALGFPELRGTLRGFVDLICCVDGRFYLIDYKSNDLGSSVADYSAVSLARCMQQHHYVLQYLIYLVALHRYLKHRVPDYDYEKHFGGVRYLFLRGMSPEHPGSGVFCDRPSLALVEALSSLLQEAA